MRRSAALLARLTAVTAVAGAALLLAAPPALAGGPTSALLVSPSAQRTASLYTTDADYALLLGAVGENPTADKQAPNPHGDPDANVVNITWLIHDVQVWRVDRVFLDVDGGPWVETMIARNETTRFYESGVVHRPNDQTGLLRVLGNLGLAGDLPARKTPPPAPAQVPEAADNSVPAASVTPEKAADPNWLWLLIGAAAGAVIVVGIRPVLGLVRVRNRVASHST
jgi:hypothetical protein